MPERTLGAKQVASRMGVDAKKLRKFLRSKHSPFPAVGQGARYDFSPEEFAQIKESYAKWRSTLDITEEES